MNGALALTLLRLALAPVAVALGLTRAPGWTMAVTLVAGFVSDVLDGVVARRTGTATAALRRLDSVVDTVFYLGVAAAAWLLYRDAIRPVLPWIGAVVGTELLTNAVSWLRFRREASYHSLTARVFGFCLFGAMLVLFLSGSAALIVPAVVVGLLSHAENLAITFTLPEWRHDVYSIFVAMRLRRALLH
ncbi:MAG TPA: CDP-alcohol phosphatidyltransferase family protein [Gemmatimonadaceae bacterium]|nr:CDP-alcohol phosphatidyltransferase family protein [Gemmatimonadaceae bacterium]